MGANFIPPGLGAYAYSINPPCAGIPWDGTIATGGASQLAAPADPLRIGIMFQNNSAHTMSISDNGPATAVSRWVLPPGLLLIFPYVPPGALYVYGTTTGDPFSLTTWSAALPRNS